MSSTVNVNEPGRPAVDQDEIADVAALARIRIADEEVAGVTARIGDILSMVAALQAVDTAGVEPMANPLDATQPLRPDEVTEGDRRAEFQAIAPAVEDGLYLVPKVID
jgi:aspartyl-tRNA(Asn)/glutamyl-tRNA(Gln) amidotransferase subunit C